MSATKKNVIIEVIEREGPAMPKDLVRILQISPQALHRHLNHLVNQMVLERHGRPPFTRYGLAGMPDFPGAVNWVTMTHTTENPSSKVCETRDVFTARLSRLARLENLGLTRDELSLLIAVVGEVGNNSFDHNLGQWRDVPGVWFEDQNSDHTFAVVLADRGQGVLSSLRHVDPDIADDQSALRKAFEERISGRAPEQRGNGLKFVTDAILRGDGRGIACASGTGRIEYGSSGRNCVKALPVKDSPVMGTITLISWRLG